MPVEVTAVKNQPSNSGVAAADGPVALLEVEVEGHGPQDDSAGSRMLAGFGHRERGKQAASGPGAAAVAAGSPRPG